jgi:hypothetical protein
MVKFFYLLRVLQLLAPWVWGAVTGIIRPFWEGIVYFYTRIWEDTDRIADGMVLSVMKGRVLPSLWSVTLFWIFKIAALFGMFVMIQITARVTLLIPLILSWIFTFLAWFLRVLS